MQLIRTTGRGATKAREALVAFEQRGTLALDGVEAKVRSIVNDVRRGGDRALLRLIQKFDQPTAKCIERVTSDEMKTAWEATVPNLREALTVAADQIRRFAEKQLPQEWSFEPVAGLVTGQCLRPLGAVGCYVPSGRHPLPSTLLMTAIPAQVAGVKRIVVVSPKPATETLAAAHLLGIHEFYRIGGAHAVAALAYGTETIARVDKIVGPGSLFVTAAKRMVAFDCAIDMIAGPTEIVVTSETGDPIGIAADIIAQAEHDPEAFAAFITTQETLAQQVLAELKQRVKINPTAREALSKNGFVIVAKDLAEARDLTNRLAPEHLTVDSKKDLAWVENAGSVFVGRYSAQPMGDYISGPNHTLPTVRNARLRGGLSVMDFVKVITVQEYSAKALKTLAPHAIALAEAEGLFGHAEAIAVRDLPSRRTASRGASAGRNSAVSRNSKGEKRD